LSSRGLKKLNICSETQLLPLATASATKKGKCQHMKYRKNNNAQIFNFWIITND